MGNACFNLGGGNEINDDDSNFDNKLIFVYYFIKVSFDLHAFLLK